MDTYSYQPHPWYLRWWGILFWLGGGFVLLFILYVGRNAYLYRVGNGPTTLETISQSFTPASTEIADKTGDNPFVTVNLFNPKDPTIGPDNAKLTIIEFGDFQCPFCREVFPTVRKMESRYKDKVRFQYRHFPVSDIHPDAMNAAKASMCAHEQEKFWQYHDLLFINQQDLSLDALRRHSNTVGLNQKQFEECLSANSYQAVIDQDLSEGIAAGVRGTPTFFFNGVKVEGAIPPDVFDQLVQGILERLNSK
ncbi:MAG: DsbA family protein [bacterium]